MEILDWGMIDYKEALQRQEELVEKVANENHRGILVFCSHPPVVTVGRATQDGDIFSWNGPKVEVSRGGRATYHGPNQLVVYPILNLQKVDGPERDINWFLRSFEKAIVQTLEVFGLQAKGKSRQEDVGVWVANLKIASLGIAVRRWVSYHGAAINLDFDASAFQGIKPCGFDSEIMISMEELLGAKVDREHFKLVLSQKLSALLFAKSSEILSHIDALMKLNASGAEPLTKTATALQ